MMNHNFNIAGYSGIDTATMFGAGGGFSAFTQPTGYGFDYHAGTGDPAPDACHIAGRAMVALRVTPLFLYIYFSYIHSFITLAVAHLHIVPNLRELKRSSPS
jgi:hypothetical protein